ncbi:hypothetical protein KCTC52924_01409 [Arenibacter antarcticus]
MYANNAVNLRYQHGPCMGVVHTKLQHFLCKKQVFLNVVISNQTIFGLPTNPTCLLFVASHY